MFIETILSLDATDVTLGVDLLVLAVVKTSLSLDSMDVTLGVDLTALVETAGATVGFGLTVAGTAATVRFLLTVSTITLGLAVAGLLTV